MTFRDFERGLARLVDPLTRRVLALAARATLMAAEDRKPVMAAQVKLREDEVLDHVELLQSYGHASAPLPGARCLLISLGGDRSHSVVAIADARMLQPRALAPGETMLWDHLGKMIHLREDGSLHIKAPKLVIDVDDLVLLASHRYRLDVHGLAQETRHLDGVNYETEAWSTGATVMPQPTNAVAPPHSEAPPE
jgi:phage baseplate assembly protein V